MQKPRRGAAGLLLAFMLVVPAPVLAGCRQTARVVEQGAEEAGQGAVRQGTRNYIKRAGHGGGATGIGVYKCASSDDCPPK
jgi:hypothetical protein